MRTGHTAGIPAHIDQVLGGMDAACWDRLAGPWFYSTSTWLNHCAGYPGAISGAVVVGLSGNRTAAAPVARFTSTPPPNYDWSDILAARGLPVPPSRGMLVGPRQGYQTHLLADRADSELVAALISEIRQSHRRQNDMADSACVAMYLSTADVHAALEAGVRTPPVLLEPDAWIEVPEGGWDAWLDSLPSKRRITVRREVRGFGEAGCVITHTGLSECYELLPPLAESMAIKYGYQARAEDFRDEFRRYAEATGDLARVALCHRDDGVLIGFCIYYIWAGTVYLRWASFDYARLTGGKEYFNLSYYSQIRVAGDAGASWVHAGKKALEPKVLRGARLRPLWLLDLSECSVLERNEAVVRAHNARLFSSLRADVLTGAAIADPDEWTAFC